MFILPVKDVLQRVQNMENTNENFNKVEGFILEEVNTAAAAAVAVMMVY